MQQNSTKNGFLSLPQNAGRDKESSYSHSIVFVWSQYDGANIEQGTIDYGWRQNQEAKLKIVGGDLSGSNQQDPDPTIHYITSVIVP